MADTMTPTSPSSGLTLPPDTLEIVGWFVFRLAVTLIIVAALVSLLSEPLQLLIARGARNLLAMVSSQYYLKTIEYIDGGYLFTTWYGPLRGGFQLPTLLFSFGFPIACVLAIPGVFTLRYWLRGLTMVLIAFYVCVIAVAVVSDARLTSTFVQFGISLQPEWRHEFSRFIQYYLWMFTVRLYPLLMVIILVLVSDPFRLNPRRKPSKLLRVLNVVVVGVLAILVAATIGFDSVANERIETVRGESIGQRFNDIAASNPTLPNGLVKLGEFLEKQRNFEGALNAYRLAVPKLKGRPRKLARRARDRVHEQIKADLLKGSQERLRKQFGFPARE